MQTCQQLQLHFSKISVLCIHACSPLIVPHLYTNDTFRAGLPHKTGDAPRTDNRDGIQANELWSIVIDKICGSSVYAHGVSQGVVVYGHVLETCFCPRLTCFGGSWIRLPATQTPPKPAGRRPTSPGFRNFGYLCA